MKRLIEIRRISYLTAIFLICSFSLSYGASITVVSPNGGENWGRGRTHDIQWTSSEISGNVRIILQKGGFFYRYLTLYTGIPNTGTYSWTVPNDLPLDSDYKVIVESVTDFIVGGFIKDDSDRDFSIALSPPLARPPDGLTIARSLRVTSPNGGERWDVGSSHDITWSSSSSVTGNIKLMLFQDGAKVGDIIDNIPVSSGRYSWRASRAGSNYKIVIESMEDSSLRDESDDVFRIAPVIRMETTPSITVTYPHRMSFVDANTRFTIRWNKTGEMGDRVRIDLYQGSTRVQTIANTTPNGGSYGWDVPINLLGRYIIQVQTLDMVPVTGRSDEFNIRGLRRKGD